MESLLFFRLKKCSIISPGNIPILCIRSFKSNSPRWLHLVQQFSAMQCTDMMLMDLNRGVPVIALFYVTDLDLIYVRSADDFEGYVPRDNLKPILNTPLSPSDMIAEIQMDQNQTNSNLVFNNINTLQVK